LLQRLLDAGHTIGYHSMNHDMLPGHHESEREPDQFADSVTLFRYLLARFADRPVPVEHGRFPGGRGAFLEAMPRLYWAAGLTQHVFWNFGPGSWVQNTPVAEVRAMACPLVGASAPVTILLHEFPMLPLHLEALFDTIKTRCPADRNPTIAQTRTVWRKDHVFVPTLCGLEPHHPDVVGLCDGSATAIRGAPGPGEPGPVGAGRHRLPDAP
jgi:hypothetical protein